MAKLRDKVLIDD